MFFKNIEEYNRKFRLLNIVSDIVFTYWTSNDAKAYHDGELMQIQTRYQSFISEMKTLTEGLDHLQRLANELEERINKEINDITTICNSPSIQGCREIYAEGVVIDENGRETSKSDSFAIRPDEIQYAKGLANKRAIKLSRVDKVSFGRGL